MSFVRLPVLRHGLLARDPELLPDAQVAARTGKVRRLMADAGVGSLLVYSDPTRNGPACYLTNYPCFGLGRRAVVVLGADEGPLLFTAEPSRNLPRVRLLTTCEIEKTRRFLSAAADRARVLAGAKPIGVVGLANLPVAHEGDAAALGAAETRDLTEAYERLVAVKDASGLGAGARAVGLAEAGLRLVAEALVPGADLWEVAAHADYRLRLAGCEETNLLLNASAGGGLRPSYPVRRRIGRGESFVAYVAVQFGRVWGVAAGSGSAGTSAAPGRDAPLGRVREAAAAEVRAGLTLAEAQAALAACGRRLGVRLASDLPPAAGVGFDLREYPTAGGHLLEADMTLQVALAAEDEDGSTGLRAGVLRVGEGRSRWVGRGAGDLDLV